MAIRKNTNPREMDLQPEMRDILMRNGMQAHILSTGRPRSRFTVAYLQSDREADARSDGLGHQLRQQESL